MGRAFLKSHRLATLLAACTALLSATAAVHAHEDQAAKPHTANTHSTAAVTASDALLIKYMQAVQRAVQSNWLRPDSAERGIRCAVEVRQDGAGMLSELRIVEPCNADAATRQSIEAALRRAQPLPHAGFETVLSQSVRFTFRDE